MGVISKYINDFVYLDTKVSVPAWFSPILSRGTSVRETPVSIPVKQSDVQVESGNYTQISSGDNYQR